MDEDTKRYASPQAWKRLRETMTEGELADIARDVASYIGDATQTADIERALVVVDWHARRQA